MTASSAAGELEHLFTDISKPRLAGLPGCEKVVTRLAAFLKQKGYDVHLQPFVAGPEGVVAGSVFGLLLALASVVVAVVLVANPTVARLPAMARFFAVLAVVAGPPAAVAALIGSRVLSAHWIVRLLGYRLPIGPGVPDGYWVRTANITAVKGPDPEPLVWLVAHSDSKVQRHSLRTRVVAVWSVLAGAILLAVGAVLDKGDLMALVTVLGALLGVAGAGMVMARAGLMDGSPGAVDNATGVVAVLAAAEQLGWRRDVGILITGAEELAMAGAREWVKMGWSGNLFVNFDGVDGRGQYYLWVHKGASPGAACYLETQLRDRFGPEDSAPKFLKFLTFGMFVDGTVLAKTGMSGVTVQRGTFGGTVAVAHTREDTPERVDLAGALRAGQAAASVIAKMI
jgi:hypothetical protein